MELGNLMFGHSRGEYEVPRKDSWLNPLIELFKAIDKDADVYGVEFENKIFSLMPYWWGDCTWEKNDKSMKPNFEYKPTGFELRWYKYPLRDSYMNQKITLKQFVGMIDKCRKSLIMEERDE